MMLVSLMLCGLMFRSLVVFVGMAHLARLLVMFMVLVMFMMDAVIAVFIIVRSAKSGIDRSRSSIKIYRYTGTTLQGNGKKERRTESADCDKVAEWCFHSGLVLRKM